MCENVFAAINCAYSALTHAERGVAEYVLAHSQELLTMSIVDLAQSCGISNSTLFRFCRHLGYKGYREFHMALAITLHSHDMLHQQPDDSFSPLAGTLKRIYLRMVYALRQTYAALDPNVMRQIVQSLIAARRIVVIGAEESLIATPQACMAFLRFVPCTFCPQNFRARQLITESLTADEALIVFCSTDADALLPDMVERARQRGVYILAFSRSSHSPLRAAANHMLVYGHSPDNAAQDPYCLTSSIFLATALCSLYAQLAHEVSLAPEEESQ